MQVILGFRVKGLQAFVLYHCYTVMMFSQHSNGQGLEVDHFVSMPKIPKDKKSRCSSRTQGLSGAKVRADQSTLQSLTPKSGVWRMQGGAGSPKRLLNP